MFQRLVLIAVMSMLASLPARAGDDLVRIVVSAPGGGFDEIAVETVWSGEVQRVTLTELPEGRAWMGHLHGPPVHLLPIRILVIPDGRVYPVEAYAGVEVLEDGGGTLAWHLYDKPSARAQRIARPLTRGAVDLAAQEAVWTGRSLAWDVFALLAVLAIVALGRRGSSPRGPGPGWAVSLGLWILLALVWTWPAVLAGGRFMVGRHFDVAGSIWLLDAASRLLPTLHDPLSAWPAGGDYARLDSFTMLLPGWLLSGLDPVRVHGWLQILGVALSGFAAQGFARAVGARAPWTLLGGTIFVLSGLGADVLLEGHVYHLLDPWLPLFAWSWWVALGDRGRVQHGLLAGLFFLLSLLTTAYLGLAASLLAVGFWLGRRPRNLRPVWAAAALVLPAGLAYAALFLSGGTGAGGVAKMTGLYLDSLAATTPETDRALQGQALVLPGIGLALVAAAGVLLRRRRAAWTLAVTGGVAILLSLGATFGPDEPTTWFPLPLAALDSVGLGGFLKFPARLGWAGLLSFGALAAWAGTILEDRVGPWARLLVLLAVVEPFLQVGMPGRQLTRTAAIPAGYSDAEGPILDLYPEPGPARDDLRHRLRELDCYYQVGHGQAVADACVLVGAEANPREAKGRMVISGLLEGSSADVLAGLQDWGFRALVVHEDLFSAGDRARLRPALEAMGVPLHESDGEGGHLVVASIPEGEGRPLDDDAASAIGVTPAVDAGRSLRIAVDITDRAARGGHFTASIDGGAPVPLADDGLVPGDFREDNRFQLIVERDLPPELTLRVEGALGDGKPAVWQGPVRLGVRDDEVDFVFDGALTPVARMPSANSPAIMPYNGMVATFGWAVYLALALGGVWWLRRREDA